MANISDVWNGDVSIYATSKEDIIHICNILKIQENFGDYFSTYNFHNVEDRIGENKDNDEKLPFAFHTTFGGSGRWTYRENLEQFIPWLANSDDFTKEDADFLESISWRLDYEYQEYEIGCEFLRDAYHVITHDANTPLSMVVSVETSSEDYFYSPVSFMEHFANVSCLDEAIETLIWDEDDEALVYMFNQDKKYLHKTTNLSDEEIIAKLQGKSAFYTDSVVADSFVELDKNI